MSDKIRSRTVVMGDQDAIHYTHLVMWCPGCADAHGVAVKHSDGPEGDFWTWDENPESPTINPSILVRGGSPNITCHSFIRGGSWEFLSDSTHALAGTTVPMVDLPDWLSS